MPGHPIIREIAKRDLVEIVDYIGARNPTASERFVVAIKRDCAFLLSFPRAGALRTGVPRRFRGLRSWPVGGSKNYLIFYLPAEDGIDVVRVLHGARNVRRVLRETPG